MNRPTIAELRTAAQKGHHRTIGNVLARFYGRPLAIYGTWLAVRLGLSAHQVTGLALLSILLASGLLALGTPAGFVAGVLALHLAFWLDHVDGQVARWRGTASLDGVSFDYLLHHVQSLAVGFGAGLGLALGTGVVLWTLAGFLAGGGWLFLSLHNDCRYKACFQRLKSSDRVYRVEGGRAERPAPPAPWPRRGIGLWSWPAYKLCEPHAVLILLSILATLACVDSSVWLRTTQGYLLLMAGLAPALAALRFTRMIRRGDTERLFAAWFQQEPAPDVGVEAGDPSRPRPHVALR